MVGVSSKTITARWVPRMLSAVQKQQRVECSREFLYLCSGTGVTFWTGLKLRFIPMSLTQNKSPCSGRKKEQHPLRNSRCQNRPERSWPLFFGIQRGFCWLTTKKKDLIWQGDTMPPYWKNLKMPSGKIDSRSAAFARQRPRSQESCCNGCLARMCLPNTKPPSL